MAHIILPFQLGPQLPEQQSEDWSIRSQAVSLQGSAAYSSVSDGPDGPTSAACWGAASDTEHPRQSPAELLQIQAQKAAARAQQRQQKQQQVLLLQQALAKQQQAAGTCHTLALRLSLAGLQNCIFREENCIH